MSLFLVFVLPLCVSGAMTRAWLELRQGPSSGNENEEKEEKELGEEGEVSEIGTRPVEPDQIAVVPAPLPPLHVKRVLVASVAAVPHPSQFSVKRLQ